MPSFTFHGGRLDEAMRRFSGAPSPWIDLSTGINPRPFPIAAATGADQTKLPSKAALAELEAVAARRFGVRSDGVAALPGSEIGLRLLATMGLPGPVGVVLPGYRTHLDAFLEVVRIAIEDLAETASQGAVRTILLANPNNPDGRLIAPEHLIATARALTARGGWLVVDEAFADSVDGASILPLLGDSDHVLVLRSFGKFYGLAGVRLGFACGNPAMVHRLRQRFGDWPVSATAIALGTAAYRDTAWIDRARIDLAARADRLDDVLARHGFDAIGACPLFRLIETAQAGHVFERLGEAGILTRPFDYAANWLRFGLPGDGQAFARLDRALADR